MYLQHVCARRERSRKCQEKVYLYERLCKTSGNYALSAWKALQSVAIVTGYEVPGLSMRERGAWKALRHRTCNLFTATGVLPSRQDYCNSFFRGLRPRLPSLRSVVPSRHKRCMYINLFQDKTKPFISDGFEVQTIHSQPV